MDEWDLVPQIQGNCIRLHLHAVLPDTLASNHGGLEAWVATRVLDQVVTAHEALVTQGTQEAFLACVGPDVARQLVGTCKPLTTVGP